jgi:ABC-type lipoprotein export system ATPase subunit
MSAYVEFKNVKKTYKTGEVEIHALNDVNFEIEKGEFCVIVGASGAGKTTILNILGGMDTLTSGSVILDGAEISSYNKKQLTAYRRYDVGFVFQFYNLVGNLTAYENVALSAACGKDPLDPLECLEKVGIKEKASDFPSLLSGGQQQKVAIARAIAKNPAVINDEQSSLRQVMRTLVEEMPLSYTQRWVLNAANRKNTYVCVLMEYQTTHSPLPVSYICDSFEELFEDSFAFPLDQMMTGFVDIGSLGDKKKDYRAGLNRKLKDFIARMRLNAGISNEFNDLFDIRIHYLQARSALENGKMMSPAGNLFYFASYALTEMIINSLGGLPSEAYYPSGLKNVLEHDRTSGVSYLETLKVFLEENMSYTAAAQKLFIHRSTLIDRIARIERELHVNLQDSDQRLQREILLKAIDIEQLVRMQ